MSNLTGMEIKRQVAEGSIKIVPFDVYKVNANSYNLSLDNRLLVYTEPVLDMMRNNPTEELIIPESGLLLEPNRLYLGKTVEYTETTGFLPCISGRSSIARLGMFVHVTAGFGDNGFNGHWTLEIAVIHPLVVYPNAPICQIYYETLSGDPSIKYNGKYQNSNTVLASKMYQDFKKNT